MQYEIGESVDHPGYFSVEAVNYEGDGEIYTTVFLGPRSRERAEEFVALQRGNTAGSANDRVDSEGFQKSQIVPSVTVRVPMPQGAAIPRRAG